MSDLPPPPPQLPPTAGGLPYPPYPPTEKSDLPAKGPGSPGVILPRVGARILDGLIVSIPFLFLSQQYIETRGTGDNQEIIDNRPGWLLVLLVIVPMLYEFIFVTMWGQTLGKMALRLKIVRYQDGDRVQPYQAALRTIVPNAPSIIALALPLGLGQVLGLVGILIYLSALIDPIYRGIHDKAAATIVLRTK